MSKEKVKREVNSIKHQLQTKKTREEKLDPKYARERNNLVAFTEYLGYKNAQFHEDWYNFLQFSFSPFKDKVREEHLKEYEKHDT